MTDYFNAGMRLYLDHLVDWKALLEIRGGSAVDVDAEVGAYRTILETAGALAASFESESREAQGEKPKKLARHYDQNDQGEKGRVDYAFDDHGGCHEGPPRSSKR